jgi:repressor LexA
MNSTINLTPKQLRILEVIRDKRHQKGYAPTMQEIATEIGVTKVTIFEHIEALLKKGALRRDPHKARSLAVVEDALQMMERPAPSLAFPLVGRIAAGYPIERFPTNDQITLSELYGPRRGQTCPTFALEADGDSMRDSGVLDGDYIILEQRENAVDGDRVVATLPDGETVLRRYFAQDDGTIRLQAEDPADDPIVTTTCRVQGVVVGIMRRYSPRRAG